MDIKLNQIAEIKTGYTLRSSSANSIKSQRVQLISAKDIDNDFGNLETIMLSGKSNNFLKNGDILVKARGHSMIAKVFNLIGDSYLATSTLLIIKLKTTDFLPEYIESVINSTKAQQILKIMATGSTVPTLQPSSLGELKIPKIDLIEQRELVQGNAIVMKTEKILKQYLQDLQMVKIAINNKTIKE